MVFWPAKQRQGMHKALHFTEMMMLRWRTCMDLYLVLHEILTFYCKVFGRDYIPGTHDCNPSKLINFF